jgi:hypothetical protein
VVPRPWLRVHPKHYGGWCGSRIRNTPDSGPQPYLRSCLAPAHVRGVPDPSPYLRAAASVYLLALQVLRFQSSPTSAAMVRDTPLQLWAHIGMPMLGYRSLCGRELPGLPSVSPRNVPAWFRGAGSGIALGITEVVVSIESGIFLIVLCAHASAFAWLILAPVECLARSSRRDWVPLPLE